MSIDFLAGGGDYDNEPMYVIELRKRIAELEAENAMLQDRCGPSTVVLIGTVGHYVNDAVATRIAELKADKAWLQEELRKLNKENLRLQANE